MPISITVRYHDGEWQVMPYSASFDPGYAVIQDQMYSALKNFCIHMNELNLARSKPDVPPSTSEPHHVA